MKEYRKEVQVLLAADKQLASEIEFDLKRFEREQENAEAANQRPAAGVYYDFHSLTDFALALSL